MKSSILIVDDNKGILSALRLTLSHHFDEVMTLSSPASLMTTLRENDYDVVLLDMNFREDSNTGNEGLFWLSEIKKQHSCEVVLFTAYGDIELAVNGIKRGAYDFIVKPWDNDKLIKTLLDAAKLSQSKKKGRSTENRISSHETGSMFWGNSPLMTTLKTMVQKTAPSDASILITGENGTGKDMLAKEIHQLSHRKNAVFVPVDMGSMPESLFESELFGHVKGAFTDAHSDHTGKFELANGGTLFLDEIGNLPLHLQAKLLRVLQNRMITKIGGNKFISINIRLICATNTDIESMVRKGTFREDLYYRINTIHLQMPLLRERTEDIVPLVEIFMQQFARQYNKNISDISLDAKEALQHYQWGGNIRELQNCVEKAVLLCESNTLQLDDFQLNYLDFWMPKSNNDSVCSLDEMEKNAIVNAMKKFDNNLSSVAKQLDISRQTLYNKLKKYDI
ncbi:MAG: sigma-54 dependent transcriptional regulator [Bacteroidales bacterium]|nr:sigma-54 dependent transcriptional regulator [Bacteroidales bacterium]